jgi:hypothetical protein
MTNEQGCGVRYFVDDNLMMLYEAQRELLSGVMKVVSDLIMGPRPGEH